MSTAPIAATGVASAPDALSPASLRESLVAARRPLGEITHPVARGRYLSPLRYPGAKSLMVGAISTLVERAGLTSMGKVSLFVEPFAGGASTALRLVSDGLVDRILLADSDPLVACFWQAAAIDTESLVEAARLEWEKYVRHGGTDAVARWDYWREWRPQPSASPDEVRLGLALKCLFLNRTTFSGILHGRAGPIGGRAQASAYPIGCRWNADALEERIRYIGHLYDTGRLVDVWRKDWRQTVDDLAEHLPGLASESTLLYLDPPYLSKSDRLYRQSFAGTRSTSERSSGLTDLPPEQSLTLHLELADYLTRRAQHRWILSYDASDDLLASELLYGLNRMTPRDDDRAYSGVRRWSISKRYVSQVYSASSRSGRGPADELLITTIPPRAVPIDARFRDARRVVGGSVDRDRKSAILAAK